ncbi:hypothetical protein ACE6H2_005865 [Prunus campanulata]
MRLHGQKRKTHDQGSGRDLPRFMGSHHHASQSQMSIGLPTCSDQAPPCRFSASITHPKALPINTRLKLHSKAQAVNLTAEISSSLGHNRLIRGQTQTGAPLNHFTHINISTHGRSYWHTRAQPHPHPKEGRHMLTHVPSARNTRP